MLLIDKQNEFCNHVSLLIRYAQEHVHLQVTFGECFRTLEQQNIYLRNGFSKVSHSRHMDRLAIDLNFFKNGIALTRKEEFANLAAYWHGLHHDNACGYYWGWDLNHFERK